MNNVTKNKLTQYFETHPEATVVYVAIGVLTADLERANAYCGGTAAKPETFTRAEVEAWPKDEAPAEVVKEDAPVDTPVDAPVEDAPVEAPVEDAPVEDAPVEDAPVEAPVDETPADEKPADETPADDKGKGNKKSGGRAGRK